MKKNICIKEAHSGDFSKISSLQDNYSSVLRGENSFEAANGKKMKIKEVYGDKPIDEILETFSKYISQFLGGEDERNRSELSGRKR